MYPYSQLQMMVKLDQVLGYKMRLHQIGQDNDTL